MVAVGATAVVVGATVGVGVLVGESVLVGALAVAWAAEVAATLATIVCTLADASLFTSIRSRGSTWSLVLEQPTNTNTEINKPNNLMGEY